MHQGYNYKENIVLFVDDEEKALKYFHKAFDKDFQIMTATSAEEGWSIIEEKGGKIAVLISDQRMAGKTGVELLGQAFEAYPGIMRILTTAYSDLDSAIDAVNEGSIYQYVVKPWDTRELSAVLKRAIEFYSVQKERDILLKEKMSVVQRLIITDRVQSFSVLAAGLEINLNNTLMALASFVGFIPTKLQEEWTYSVINDSLGHWFDLGLLVKEESKSILGLVKEIVASTEERSAKIYEKRNLEDLINPSVELATKLAADSGKRIEVELSSDLPKLEVQSEMIEECFRGLLTGLVSFSEQGKTLCISAKECSNEGATPGTLIRVYEKGVSWDDRQMARLFSVFTQDKEPGISLSLLTAFFIIYHHSGTISINPTFQEGGGIEILLPFDPQAVELRQTDNDSLEILLSHFQRWDVERL